MRIKASFNLLAPLALLTGFLAGCESFGPSMRDKLPLEPVAQVKDEDKKQHETQFTDLNLLNDGKKKEKPVVEMYPGSGNFINGQTARRAVGRDDKSGKYTLNFDDADLGEVAKVILSDTLGENYVLAPSVSGRVTLQTSRPLTREELIPTLEILLRMNGVVLIKSDGGYRIEPAANALSGANSPRLGTIGQNIPDGFQIRVIPLRYIGVEEMQKVLEPLLPENSIVRADKVRNLMVVAGTAAELGNLLETIEIFDVNLLRGMSVLMYPLKNIDAETVVGELEEIFGSEEENPLKGMFKLIPIERMNSVMVITPQPGYLREARVWLDRLDRNVDETGAGGGVYVYRVQNIEAAALADILNGIFSEGKSKSGAPDAQTAPGTAATEIGADDSNDNQSAYQSGERSGKKSKKKSRGASASTLSIGNNQDVKIIPDEENNSLVIVASAQAYDILKKVITQLDVPALQVLIDATVVEVTLSDNLQYGVQWFFSHSLGPYGATAVLSDGAITTQPRIITTDGVPTVPPPPTGFSYSLASGQTIRAILTALASQNKVNVVASPSLMVLNNQEAKITVGDQIPFQTGVPNPGTVPGTGTGTGTTPNQFLLGGFNQVQQRQTGVILKIKPRVNAGGMVIMEIDQTASQPILNPINPLQPTIQQREIESVIAVQSGNTLVLGGLIRDQRDEIHSGIPFLKDIPYIGWLFSQTTKKLARTELVILITPRVVQQRNDAELITREFKRKLTGLYEEVSEQPAKADDRSEASPQGMKKTR